MKPCECAEAGHCHVFDRDMSIRDHQICSGGCPKDLPPCPDHVREAHRLRWARKEPTAAGMAVNFVRDAAKHAKDGGRKVPLHVYEARLAECKDCVLYVDNVCKHPNCGCSMAGEGKWRNALHWASKECPLGRWEAYVEPLVPTKDRLVVTLAVGAAGEAMLAITEPYMRRYAARIGADFYAVHVAESDFPEGEKFRIAELIPRYRRTLFLDADVAPSGPDIFDAVPEKCVGLHDDGPYIHDKEWLRKETEAVCAALELPVPAQPKCYNTGVAAMSRQHAFLFAPPERPYPKYHCSEQHIVNCRLSRCRVAPLDWRWNCQHWIGFRPGAYFLHFANCEGKQNAMEHRLKSIVCGVTTVPDRMNDLLPRTLASLEAAGFPPPRLFVDGAADVSSFGLAATVHEPPLRAYGNWILGLAELLIREPAAKMYGVFQDDLVMCRGVYSYIRRRPPGRNQYYNLFTFSSNEDVIRGKPHGWYEAGQLGGSDPQGRQTGRGAVALVFPRDAVLALLTHQHAVERPLDPARGWRAVDGGVVCALNKAGFREMIHAPSLVEHTGASSSMGNGPFPPSVTFPGESFDCAAFADDTAEVGRIRRAMEEDEERLLTARAPAERARLTAYIKRYKEELDALR